MMVFFSISLASRMMPMYSSALAMALGLWGRKTSALSSCAHAAFSPSRQGQQRTWLRSGKQVAMLSKSS